ncbi:MAG: hypothetical protein IJC98_01265 [Clostridia bacterium]|nr:hypothetical protein [Clostridia bacterium]
MKKFFKNLKKKADNAAIAAKIAIDNKRAEGYVDTGIKIIIAVVIGSLILAGLYTLFNGTVIPQMQSKVGGMFSYSGS